MPSKTWRRRDVTPKIWRESLMKLRKFIVDYIRKEWRSNELLEFVLTRFSGAAEIIVRSDVKVGSVVIKGLGATAVMTSSKLLERGPQRILKVKTFDGDIVEIPIGTPPEEGFHVTQVGPYGLKCTCEDSVMTASKADREFIDGLRRAGIAQISSSLSYPIFSRFVLCKHSLALLAYLIAAGIISLRSRTLKQTIKLAVLGAALKVLGADSVGIDKIVQAYYILLKRSALHQG